MRANVEDTDISSNKIRMAAAYMQNAGIQISHEHAVLGIMVRIWYHAVNDKKKRVSIEDLSEYLLIIDRQSILDIATCLVSAKYLKHDIDGNMYEIVGKDKDFDQKMLNEEMSKLNNEARKKKTIDKLKHQFGGNSPSADPCAVPPAVPSTVPPAVPSTVPSTVSLAVVPTVPSVVPSTVPHSIHSIHALHSVHSVHNNTLQDNINNQSTSSLERQEKDSHKPTQVLKKAYAELYYKEYGKEPFWGAAENTNAKRLLTSVPLDRAVALLEPFFSWNNKEVIDGGHSFCKGFKSFTAKIDELQADILKPDRRIRSKMADMQVKAMSEEQVKRMNVEKMMRRLKEDKSREGELDVAF